MARLNEIKKLQKIAGIIKENVNEAPESGNIGAKVTQIISQLKPQEDEYQNWVGDDEQPAQNTKVYMFKSGLRIPGYDGVVVGDQADGKKAYWLVTLDRKDGSISGNPYGYPDGILEA